ncbi:MAG: GldG family protein [Spirochaetaceae bacterium]|nr:GldG family protein [Spirochaetaceae bacterium]
MKKPSFNFDFKTRHAGISALITIAVLAAVLLVNILAGQLELKADLTPKKLFSLTDETKGLLKSLETEVEIIALFEPGKEPEPIMETINQYSHLSRKVSIKVIDPDREPALVARYSEEDTPISKGSFIVSSKDFFRIITAMEMYDVSYSQQGQPQVLGQKIEQQITSAIAFVISGRTPKIYEITGHRESPLGSLGYAQMLTQANYILEELSITLSAIPDDAALLTLIGPRSDLSEAEAGKINDYLNSGGSLLIAMNLTHDPMPNIYTLLESWDIEVRHGLVMETRANRLIAEFGDNPFVFAPFLSEFGAVTSLNEAKTNPIFQASLGFKRTDAQQRKLEYFTLLSSSEDSRLRTDLTSEASGNPAVIPGDMNGPIDVAIAVQQRNMDSYKPEGARIVALGSASTLKGLGALGQIKANADLVMNLVNWSIDEDSTVNVPSKSLFRLPLRIDTLTGLIYAGITIIIIPFLCLGAGLFIYFRRRNK